LTDDEAKLHGREAQEVLEHPAWKRALQKVREDAVGVFLKTDDPVKWAEAKKLADAAVRLALLLKAEVDNAKIIADKDRKGQHRGND
jgi:hypothetical protein